MTEYDKQHYMPSLPCAREGCGKNPTEHIGWALAHLYVEPKSDEPGPQWREYYLTRKADEYIRTLRQEGVTDAQRFAEVEATVRSVARTLVAEVMNEMTIHFTHPHPLHEEHHR